VAPHVQRPGHGVAGLLGRSRRRPWLDGRGDPRGDFRGQDARGYFGRWTARGGADADRAGNAGRERSRCDAFGGVGQRDSHKPQAIRGNRDAHHRPRACRSDRRKRGEDRRRPRIRVASWPRTSSDPATAWPDSWDGRDAGRGSTVGATRGAISAGKMPAATLGDGRRGAEPMPIEPATPAGSDHAAMLSAGSVGETRTSRRRYAATGWATIIPGPVGAIAGGAERIAAGPGSALPRDSHADPSGHGVAGLLGRSRCRASLDGRGGPRGGFRGAVACGILTGC